MEQFKIRKATINDSDFFYEVKKVVLKNYIEKIWGWDEGFQMQFHKENYHVANTNIIIIIEYAAGTVEVSEEEERVFISSLYLLPPYQNKEIGTAIIAGYTHKATGENKRVELKVLKLNVNAQRFYKRLDFTLTERDDTQYFMYKDCK